MRDEAASWGWFADTGGMPATLPTEATEHFGLPMWVRSVGHVEGSLAACPPQLVTVTHLGLELDRAARRIFE